MNDKHNQLMLLMIFTFLLFVLFCCALTAASGVEPECNSQTITIPLDTSTDTLAVQVLIEKFESTDYILRTDDEGHMMAIVPAFACYAQACAKLDGAAPILTEVLAGGTPTANGPSMVYSQQARVAAAIALEAIGPEAMVAWPTLAIMLHSPQERENIVALAVIRGIGPEAASLLTSVRTLLYAEDFHTRYWACRAVAAMGDAGEPAAADLCLLLMMDEPASVRRNACIALGEVAPGSQEADIAVRLLAEVLATDYSHPVQVEAKVALKKIFAFRARLGPGPNNPPDISPGFLDSGLDSDGDGVDGRAQN